MSRLEELGELVEESEDAAPASGSAAAGHRPVPARVLAQPAARPLADLVPRLGDAAALRRRGAHRLPLPRRLQPRPRRQRRDRRLRGRPLLLRLADEPGLALLVDPGAARDRRLRRDPDPAGEAVVGDPEAVRAPAGALGRARPRAAEPAAARRLLDLPVRHRRDQRPVLAAVRVLVRPRPLLRGDDLPRRAGAAPRR